MTKSLVSFPVFRVKNDPEPPRVADPNFPKFSAVPSGSGVQTQCNAKTFRNSCCPGRGELVRKLRFCFAHWRAPCERQTRVHDVELKARKRQHGGLPDSAQHREGVQRRRERVHGGRRQLHAGLADQPRGKNSYSVRCPAQCQ